MVVSGASDEGSEFLRSVSIARSLFPAEISMASFSEEAPRKEQYDFRDSFKKQVLLDSEISCLVGDGDAAATEQSGKTLVFVESMLIGRPHFLSS